ncbi:hypothetical protein TNCV_4147571 [Trichonephila clavipes]|nr:hypothetical protein TNCV_4147571 [Trichonephila clavipes]
MAPKNPKTTLMEIMMKARHSLTRVTARFSAMGSSLWMSHITVTVRDITYIDWLVRPQDLNHIWGILERNSVVCPQPPATILKFN